MFDVKNIKMTTTKINTFTWIALILLITLSYYFAEAHLQNAAFFIAIVSIIKFIAVGFQFMEAKKANIAWQFLLVLFVFIYLAFIFILY